MNDVAATVSQPALMQGVGEVDLSCVGEPGTVYYIPGDSPHVRAISAGTIHVSKTTSTSIHERLSHIHDRSTTIMQNHSMLDGLEGISISRKRGKTQCNDDGCFHGKMHKTSVPQVSGRVPRAPGSDLSCDIGGPMPVRSLGGFYYFCLLKDLYTLCRYIFYEKEGGLEVHVQEGLARLADERDCDWSVRVQPGTVDP